MGTWRQAQSFYFILMDIDKFKLLNDTFGHDCGDQVLQWIVSAFQKYLEKHDILIRMGGDEFALITSWEAPQKLIQLGLAEFEKMLAKHRK